MDPVPRLLPLTSPRAHRESHGEQVSAQARRLLVGTMGHAWPGPSGGFSPATWGGKAFIPGRGSVSVRGPGAWILSCTERGVQSSSRKWHPITRTTASEMQLFPGSMWSRGRPGRRAPGLWGSPIRDCSWRRVSWPPTCRWLGFKVVGQPGASGAASAAAVRNGVSSRSFLGRKCVTSPFTPREEFLRVPGSGEGSRPATVLREVLLSCTQGLSSCCWELLFQDLLPSLCRCHTQGPAPTGQGSAPG